MGGELWLLDLERYYWFAPLALIKWVGVEIGAAAGGSMPRSLDGRSPSFLTSLALVGFYGHKKARLVGLRRAEGEASELSGNHAGVRGGISRLAVETRGCGRDFLLNNLAVVGIRPDDVRITASGVLGVVEGKAYLVLKGGCTRLTAIAAVAIWLHVEHLADGVDGYFATLDYLDSLADADLLNGRFNDWGGDGGKEQRRRLNSFDSTNDRHDDSPS
jgi:hypothetical protein